MFVGAITILLILRILLHSADSFYFLLANEIIAILSFLILGTYLIGKIRQIKPSSISLVVNIGIINAFVFFAIAFSDYLFNLVFEEITINPDRSEFFKESAHFSYALIFLLIGGYLLIILRELYFLKQQRNVKIYYVLMLVFFLLASVSKSINKDSSLSYLSDPFFVVAVLLMIFNSARISWIAFIEKKEKISLLILSVIILTLFILNLVNSNDQRLHNTILIEFSQSFNHFFYLLQLYGAIYFGFLFFTTLFHIPTAEAYDRKAKEVSSLQYFSKLITQVLDIKELSDTITDIAIKVSSADAAWIVLKENKETTTLANKNIAFVDADIINRYLLDSGMCNDLKESMICNLDKYKLKYQLSEKFGSITISPLRSYNQIKGYLIAARKNELIFYEEDKTALNTFSDYASVAMENSLLLEQSMEKERLEKELDVAREIQRKILPVSNPVFENLSVSSVFIPAFEVGGDYYDFFEVSENKLGFIIADVSGKGISAAFIMAEIKGIFESLSKLMDSPKEILVKANQILKRTLDKQNFVSALFGIIDRETDTLSFARAGHCPALLIRDGKIKSFKPSGIGLGLTNSYHFKENLEEYKIILKNNDTVVLYTDGITESKNNDLEDFGDDRFVQLLVSNSDERADEIAQKVISKVTSFSSNHSQYDDITLVILKWNKKNNIVNHGEVPENDGMEIENGRIQHLN
jgi:serine phosphatase RsbU (regulator of sigma subunit)